MIVHIGREFLNLNDAQKEENVVEIVAILDHGHFLKSITRLRSWSFHFPNIFHR